MRVVVGAADDNQVFDAPSDEEFVVFYKPEVAGAQVIVPSAGQSCVESVLRQLRLVPVTTCSQLTRHPNFSHLTWRAQPASCGVDNRDMTVRQRCPAADHAPGGFSGDRLRAANIWIDHARWMLCGSGHQERCFSKSITGSESRGVKAVTAKRFGKPHQRTGIDWLRRICRDSPSCQIEIAPMIPCGALRCPLVTRIWRDGGGGTKPRHHPEPQQRLLRKFRGRHQI